MPRFRDLVSRLNDLEDGLTIFAVAGLPVGPDSDVIILDEEADEVPSGVKYMLEVDIAKDVLRVWSNWRNGRQPSINEACAAILYYAEKDAYQPVE